MAIDRTHRNMKEFDSRQVAASGELTGIERILKLDEVSSDLINLIITKDQETIYNVTYPLETKNEFELIPYQDALLGRMVSYFKTNTGRRENDVKSSTWELQVKSGPLQGKTYTQIRWYFPE